MSNTENLESDMWETCSVGSSTSTKTNNTVNTTYSARPFSSKRVMHWKHRLSDNVENEVELNTNIREVLNGLSNLLRTSQRSNSLQEIHSHNTSIATASTTLINNVEQESNVQVLPLSSITTTSNKENMTTCTNNNITLHSEGKSSTNSSTMQEQLKKAQELLRQLDSERRHYRGYALRQQKELEVNRKERAMLKERLHESHHTLITLRKDYDNNKRRIRLLNNDKDRMTEEMMELRRFIRSIEPSLRAQTVYMVSTDNTDNGNNINATQVCEEALELVPDRRFEEAFRDKMEVISSRRKCNNARLLFERTRETMERWMMENEDIAERIALLHHNNNNNNINNKIWTTWTSTLPRSSREDVHSPDEQPNDAAQSESIKSTTEKELNGLLHHKVHFNTSLAFTSPSLLMESPSRSGFCALDEKEVRWALQNTKFTVPLQQIKKAITHVVDKMNEINNHELQQLYALYLELNKDANLPEVMNSSMSHQLNACNRARNTNGNNVVYSDKQRCYEKYVNQIRRKTSELAHAVVKSVNEAITHLVQIENESRLNEIVESEQRQNVHVANDDYESKTHNETLKHCIHKEKLCSETNQSAKLNNTPSRKNKKNMTTIKTDRDEELRNENKANMSICTGNSNNLISEETKTIITTKSIVANNMSNIAHVSKNSKYTPNKELTTCKMHDINTCENDNFLSVESTLPYLTTLVKSIYNTVKYSLEQHGEHVMAEKLCDPLHIILSKCSDKVDNMNTLQLPSTSVFAKSESDNVHVNCTTCTSEHDNNVTCTGVNVELSELLQKEETENQKNSNNDNDIMKSCTECKEKLSKALTEATEVSVAYLNYLLNGKKEMLQTCTTRDVDQTENDCGDAEESKVNFCIDETENCRYINNNEKTDNSNNIVSEKEHSLYKSKEVLPLEFSSFDNCTAELNVNSTSNNNYQNEKMNNERKECLSNETEQPNSRLYENQNTSDKTLTNSQIKDKTSTLSSTFNARRHTMPELMRENSSKTMLSMSKLPSSPLHKLPKQSTARRRLTTNATKLVPTSIIRLPQTPMSKNYMTRDENISACNNYIRSNYVKADKSTQVESKENELFWTQMSNNLLHELEKINQHESEEEHESALLSSTVRVTKTATSNKTINEAKLEVRPATMTNSVYTNLRQVKLHSFDSNVCKASKQTPPINVINMKLEAEITSQERKLINSKLTKTKHKSI